MSNHTIEKATVDAAIAAARDALANEPGLTWIKSSALLERAYNWGLFFGLRAIADEDSLRQFVLHTVIDTIWQRDTDDTFITTTIGRDCRVLREMLGRDDPTRCAAKKMIEKLRISVDDQDRQWQGLVKHTRELLSEIQSVGADSGGDANVIDNVRDEERRSELHRLLHGLENLARRIALIETDHSMQKRFDE